MSTPIPEIRAKMRVLAHALEKGLCSPLHAANEIRYLAEETRRRPAIRHARVQARAITADIVSQVKFLAAADPDLAQRDIGRRVGIDGGRVSEILNGLRDSSGAMI